MNVIFYDKFSQEADLKLDFFDGQNLTFKLNSSSFEEVLSNSDFITIHIPASDKYIIDSNEFKKMKDGSGILNLSRGGIINEEELIKNIETGKISFAAIDTFEGEPNPSIKILMNSSISLTPHIGAATNEAQDRIGIELAEKIKKYGKPSKTQPQERVNEYSYTGKNGDEYTMTEDITSGDIEIIKDNINIIILS